MNIPRDTLLVVEDFDPDYEVVRRRLRALAPHFYLHRLRDFRSAISWLQNPLQYPRLVLLDLTLRDGNAADLLLTFRRTLRNVPIIVWSACLDPRVRRLCLALGADRFIRKVADARTIAAQVDSLILRWALKPSR